VCWQRFWYSNFEIKNGTPTKRCTTSSPHIHGNEIKLKLQWAQKSFIFLDWRYFQINKTNNRSQRWGVLSYYMGSHDKDFGIQILK